MLVMATSNHLTRKEVASMLEQFVITVAAGVVVHLISKWLDSRK